MAIKFITGNNKKFAELQAVLAPIEIEMMSVDLVEIQSLDPHEIIKHKLSEAFKHHSGKFIVEDSAMYMEALGGKLPGPLIKWFNETVGTDGLANISVKLGNKEAHATTIIGYAENADDIKFFEGRISGTIVSPRGDYLFGYDPIFLPQGQTLTLSELKSNGDFHSSPRGLATAKFKAYLEN